MENLDIDHTKIQTKPVITFALEDMLEVSDPHNDDLVIQANISSYEVAQIFVDSGSSVNVV